MSSGESQRSRWLLKAGDADEKVYEQPRADYFISPLSSSNVEYDRTVVQYPLTVSDSPNSDYVRCYWSPEKFSMCEKMYGCCADGCCPKDEWWMAGVYVLIAFVVIVALIAVVVGVVCYQRGSKRKQQESAYYNDKSSAMWNQPYGSEVGSQRSVKFGAPY